MCDAPGRLSFFGYLKSGVAVAAGKRVSTNADGSARRDQPGSMTTERTRSSFRRVRQMRIGLLTVWGLLCCTTFVPQVHGQTPVFDAEHVFNYASSEPSLAPGVIALVFGNNLAVGRCSVLDTPLPETLCGTRVTIGGQTAPLLFASSGEIRFQIPVELEPGDHSAVVTAQGQPSEPVVLGLKQYAPAIFTRITQNLTVGGFFRQTDSGEIAELITPDRPARGGEVLVGLATGLGPADPPVPTGFPGNGEALLSRPRVFILGEAKAMREAEVLSARATGGVGTASVEFVLPNDLPPPPGPGFLYDVELLIESEGEVFRSPPEKLPAVVVGDHEIAKVVDAAGGRALVSPGSIVSVFGNFLHITATASSIPLPENLNGFSVLFNGLPGALFGVFDGGFRPIQCADALGRRCQQWQGRGKGSLERRRKRDME